MLPIRGGKLGSSVPSRWRDRIRLVQRFSERYGLALEVLLLAILPVVFVIGLFAFMGGAYGAHGNGPDPVWGLTFIGSWFFLFFGLVVLGLLVTLNGVVPLLWLSNAEVAIDDARYQSLPEWYLTGLAIKLCCAVVTIITASLALLAWGILVVDSLLLSVPDDLVDTGNVGMVAAMIAVPQVAAALGFAITVHALGSTLRFAYASIRGG